jgi:hypothetical protein
MILVKSGLPASEISSGVLPKKEVHLDVSDEAEVSLKWEEQEPDFDPDIV